MAHMNHEQRVTSKMHGQHKTIGFCYKDTQEMDAQFMDTARLQGYPAESWRQPGRPQPRAQFVPDECPS